VTPKVPRCERRQRRIAGERRSGRNALFEESIRVLLTAHRSAAYEPIQLCLHHDIREPLAACRDAICFQNGRQLRTCGISAFERGSNQGVRAAKDLFRQFEFPVHVRICRMYTRAGEREKPS
jgi:hypothetical protein